MEAGRYAAPIHGYGMAVKLSLGQGKLGLRKTRLGGLGWFCQGSFG